jgi:hypothetical protein
MWCTEDVQNVIKERLWMAKEEVSGFWKRPCGNFRAVLASYGSQTKSTATDVKWGVSKVILDEGGNVEAASGC